MQKINLKHINETLYYEKLDCGLQVYFIPKNNFNKTYVTLSTKYGAINNHFYDEDGNLKDVIPGTAHFLEHKIFELPDKSDAFMHLSNIGAQANAFTSHTQTSYLFSTTTKLKEATDILLDFVYTDTFNEESTNREKGIITEEVKMYQDYPYVMLQTALLKNMYKNNAIRDEVSGTVDDVLKIDYQHLKDVYRNYYHPSNMVFVACGKINVEEYIKQIKDKIASFTFKQPLKIYQNQFDEPENVLVKQQVIEKNVNVSLFLMGIKLPLIKENIAKEELKLSMLLSLILGESSQNYEQLFDEDLISDDFEVNLECEKDYNFIILGGSSNNPEKLEKRLHDILINKENHNFDENDFNRLKKKLQGNFIMSLNSIENIVNVFTRYTFLNENYFSMNEILESISYNDIIELKNIFKEECISAAILK